MQALNLCISVVKNAIEACTIKMNNSKTVELYRILTAIYSTIVAKVHFVASFGHFFGSINGNCFFIVYFTQK